MGITQSFLSGYYELGAWYIWLVPDAYTVEGFPVETMPRTLKDELSQEDLDAIVAYLLTLR